MFGFFFTTERVVDSFAKVMACDTERFKRFFHRMLEEGRLLRAVGIRSGLLVGGAFGCRYRYDDCGGEQGARQFAFRVAGPRDAGVHLAIGLAARGGTHRRNRCLPRL